MKKIIVSSVLTASMFTPTAYASLASNAVLDFTDGIESCAGDLGTYPDDCTYGIAVNDNAGSYFSAGTATPGITDRRAMISAGTGVTLGAAQAIGEIDETWLYGGNPGNHYTQGDGPTVVSASGNTATVSMVSWTLWWGPLGEEGSINLGTGVDAVITCGVDCSVGDLFVLDYSACIPTGTFPTCPDYFLHLEGIIAAPSAVPVPAAVWLFGSGLIGLIGVARRKA